MLELSDILQKNLISKETSKIIGKIKNVYFSKSCSEIAYFVLEDCINNIHLITPSDILAFGDALMTHSSVLIKEIDDIDVTQFASNLIDMSVYTQTGILKGSICSVQFSRSGKISKMTTNEYSFTPQNVAHADDVILLKAQNRNTKQRNIHLPKASQDIPVELFEHNTQNTALEPQNQTIPVYSAPPATPFQDGVLFSDNAIKLIGAPQIEDGSAITRIISDYGFLLGRTLSDNLNAFSGKPISKKGDIVTAQTIENARFAGKLTELVLLSK